VTAVDERVAFLEGRVAEHSQRLSDIRETIVHLEQRMDRRFDNLDAKVSRQFLWLVGLQVTTLVAIVAALVAR
jgi:uncharacterized coiled-coil protein SlyX